MIVEITLKNGETEYLNNCNMIFHNADKIVFCCDNYSYRNFDADEIIEIKASIVGGKND